MRHHRINGRTTPPRVQFDTYGKMGVFNMDLVDPGLRAVFNRIDREHRGELQVGDFVAIARGWNGLSRASLEHMLWMLDSDANARLDWGEFCEAHTRARLNNREPRLLYCIAEFIRACPSEGDDSIC